MIQADASIFRRWVAFTQERFPLGAHLPMVILFTLGNIAFARRLTYSPDSPLDFASPVLGVSALLCLSFFFRLRCFDEIKDYEVDLKVNPTRPLARGLLSLTETKSMIAGLTFLELILAGLFGVWPLLVHILAMSYSFLMYREFFIGKWLRPHLTTYAVTHTFVSCLLGLSLMSQYGDLFQNSVIKDVALATLCNWAMFNLFEFARKTFAPEEEKPHVDTYSSLFKPWGAVCLSLSQIGVTLGILSMFSQEKLWGRHELFDVFALQGGLSLVVVFPAVIYGFFPKKANASIFRAATSVYLLLFYGLLSWQLLSA